MLAIRMQRTGRKGHAMYRLVVQESRLTPTSGRIVAQIGHYDPHSKAITLEKDKAQFYLTNGAQPSDRVAHLLKAEGIKLPTWVSVVPNKSRTTRNSDKLRKYRPAEAEAEKAPAETEETEDKPIEAAEAEETAVEPESDEKASEEVVDAEEPTIEDKSEEPASKDEPAKPIKS